MIKRILSVFLACFMLASCGDNPAKNTPPVTGTARSTAIGSNKALALSIARHILEDPGNNKNIWNLSEVDTTLYFETDDYFTNSQAKNKLVLLGGEAGGSSGTASCLLMLLNWSQKPQVLWAGQVSAIGDTDIKDLDNDGIKEIVMRTEISWMGECFSDFQVFNFKGGTQHELYDGMSHSIIDCGGADTIATRYKPGDTLSTEVTSSLINRSGRYAVKRVSVYKIHNGGKDDDELMKNMKIITDSGVVELK
jgi:hypothetical protein